MDIGQTLENSSGHSEKEPTEGTVELLTDCRRQQWTDCRRQ